MGAALAMDAAETVKDVAALLEQGRLPDAIARARQALNDGVEAPLLLNLRAYWFESQKRPREALVDLERACVLSPNDPAILNALGLSLAWLGRHAEAVATFQRCARAAPGFAPAYFNSGWAFEELGELEKARLAFEEAARLTPQTADPWARLAALAARRGRWDEARAMATRALPIDPLQPTATMAMANAELAGKSLAAAKARLEALIGSTNISGRDRATALGLLGDVLDGQALYREAFAAYSASNTLFKSVFAENAAVQTKIPMGEYVDWLLQSFKGPVGVSWPRSSKTPSTPDDAARHVFLLGFPRSGTTLLEEVLACHPDVVTTGEKDALVPIVRELFATTSQLERLRSLSENDAASFRKQYRDGLLSLGVEAAGKTLVDKQPFNTIRLPLIARLFPDAKIIFSLRDPRDVVLSCFRRRFALNSANAEFLTLDSTAKLYDKVMHLAAIYGDMLRLPTITMRNEDISGDFEAQIRALCRFLEIDWVDAFREFSVRTRTRDVATPSAAQIQSGIGRQGVEQWRHYAREMADVLPRLAPWVEKFGYAPD